MFCWVVVCGDEFGVGRVCVGGCGDEAVVIDAGRGLFGASCHCAFPIGVLLAWSGRWARAYGGRRGSTQWEAERVKGV